MTLILCFHEERALTVAALRMCGLTVASYYEFFFAASQRVALKAMGLLMGHNGIDSAGAIKIVNLRFPIPVPIFRPLKGQRFHVPVIARKRWRTFQGCPQDIALLAGLMRFSRGTAQRKIEETSSRRFKVLTRFP
jgi:hypothetical protein